MRILHYLVLIGVLVLILGALLVYGHRRQVQPMVSGVVEANEILLGSSIGGRVATVNVREGQRVKAGQTLAVLESGELDAYLRLARAVESEREQALSDVETDPDLPAVRPERVALARASYDLLESRLERLIAGLRGQEVAAVEKNVKSAKEQLSLAERYQSQVRSLADKHAVGEDEVERAGRQTQAAKATLQVLEKELNQLRQGTDEEKIREQHTRVLQARREWQEAESAFRKQRIQQARSRLDTASATVNALTKLKEELTIAAPCDGVIESLKAQPGTMLPPRTPVISLLEDKRLFIRTYLPADRLGLQEDTELLVTTSSLPGEQFQGRVTFIAREAEFLPSNVQTSEERAKQVYRLRLALPVEGKLRPGMPVEVWLPMADKS